MPQYRAFIIGADGEFQSSGPIECADDEVALKKAKQFVDGHHATLAAHPKDSCVFAMMRTSVGVWLSDKDMLFTQGSDLAQYIAGSTQVPSSPPRYIA